MNFPTFEYYEVTGVIAESGTAIIYQGVNLLDGSVVAIKSLLPKRRMDPFIVAKFKEEANHYLYLSHPNITRLVDFIDRGNNLYLVVEYVEGVTLLDYMISLGRPLNDSELYNAFSQILDTIAYLHQNQIIHLDIKPENIMIRPDGQIKILDMGISAKLNDQKQRTRICGSPSFMAPEQIDGKELGRHTDIFALGVTLYQLASGVLPFRGGSKEEIFRKARSGGYPPITESSHSANPDLQRVLDKCLAPDYSARYSTCEAMYCDLCEILNPN